MSLDHAKEMIMLEQKTGSQQQSEPIGKVRQRMPLPVRPSSSFPPLYNAWMEQILGGPLPVETKATCEDCAMCSKDAQLAASSPVFNVKVKCCTYMPVLLNFLVGRILEDHDPKAMPAIENRMRNGI